jgi:hypothetical protein
MQAILCLQMRGAFEHGSDREQRYDMPRSRLLKSLGETGKRRVLTLVQLSQEGEITIASLGGFDLAYYGERFGQDGYRYTTTLGRTGAEREIELPVTTTPLGAVSRLEHALSGFEDERERYRQRLTDAERRLASYRSRSGGEFTFAGELAGKRAHFAEIEKSLAADIDGVSGFGDIAA